MYEFAPMMELDKDYLDIPKVGTTHVPAKAFWTHLTVAFICSFGIWIIALAVDLFFNWPLNKSDYDNKGNVLPEKYGCLAKNIPFFFAPVIDPETGANIGCFYKFMSFTRTKTWFIWMKCVLTFVFMLYSTYSALIVA
jgi:hypothetical protein